MAEITKNHPQKVNSGKTAIWQFLPLSENQPKIRFSEQKFLYFGNFEDISLYFQ